MELRGYSQVHFISVIKGGEVIKMHNIARGKSVFKFKNIEQIYDFDGSSSQESLLQQPPKVNRTLAMRNGGDQLMTDVKSECMEEENELDFGTVTLKQLKQTCKSKKRKAQKTVKLAPVKQEVIDLPSEEDELELKETLVSWKRKMLKKVKSEKMKKSNYASKFPTRDILSCTSEDTQSCLALVDICHEIINPLQIKVEVPVPNFTQPQALSCSTKIMRNVECYSSGKDLMTNLEDLQRDYLSQCFIENSVQPKSIETSSCVLNQISYDVIEDMGSYPNIPERCSVMETMMIEDLGVTDQPSICYGLEFPKKEDMTYSMTCDESLKRNSSESDPFVFRDNVSPLSCSPVIQPSNTSEELTVSTASERNENVLMMSHPPEKLLSARKVTDFPSITCDAFPERVLSEFDPFVLQDNVSLPSRSPVVQASNTSDELTVSAASEKTENVMLSHPPEKLLSARKVTDFLSMTCDESPERVLSECDPFVFQNNVSPPSCSPVIQPSNTSEELTVSTASARNDNVRMVSPPLEKLLSARKVTDFLSMTCDESPERVLSECDPFVFQDDVSPPSCSPVIQPRNTSEELTVSTASARNDNVRMVSPPPEKLLSARKVTDFLSITCDESPERVLSECDPFVFQDDVSPTSCSPVNQPSNTSEELTLSRDSERNENVRMMSHPPEKLLSARKIISPTSQERLRKAMNLDDQQDDLEIHSCKELLFDKNETRSSSLCQGVKRVRIVSSCRRPETKNVMETRTPGKERMRKRKASFSRGSVNGTQSSTTLQNIGNVCTSVQMCSRNAIAFSKRQVHDIERISAKLIAGLQSMKSIVVDALQHESRTGAKFRCNTDEVKVALESVTKAEETAQRWLGMMSRDCDRFCKIMKLAEADAPTPEKSETENQSSPDAKTTPKERKIMFADEVGGSLCAVKVFKNVEAHFDFAV